MSASPDASLDIITFELDPWAAVKNGSCGSIEAIGLFHEQARQLRPTGWPVGFEITLQERSFSGRPASDGCARLWEDFQIFYQPRETVRPLRDRTPSELAARFLFGEDSALSVDALCRANASLGGPGSVRTHEHRSSRYPSGHRSVYTPIHEVPGQIEYLLAQINGASKLDPLAFATAAMLHCLIVHPFSDGNGRLSFLLFQYGLFRKAVIGHPLIPLGPYLEKHRPDYLYALISFALNKSVTPFCDLVERAVAATAQASKIGLSPPS